MLSDLNNLYTGVIYDALRDMGITECVYTLQKKKLISLQILTLMFVAPK